MRLADLLSNTEAVAILKRRACGDAGLPLAQPFQLKPLDSKYPERQVRNTAAAKQARMDSTAGVGEQGVENA